MNFSQLPQVDGILVNVAQQLPSITVLVHTAALFSGIILVAWAAMIAKDAHRTNEHSGSYTRAFYIFVAGIMLINAHQALGIWSETILGSSQPEISILAYPATGNGASELSRRTLMAVLAFVQFVGLLSFVRGWHILPQIGQRQEATLGKALTHVVGGVLAVNVVTFAKITAWSLGLTVISAILDGI